jgi:hypothetical protein
MTEAATEAAPSDPVPEAEYVATVHGTLDTGSIYPFTNTDDYVVTQAQLDAAASNALGGISSADFYLIARLQPYEPVYRVRWMLNAQLSGPTLRANGAAGLDHDASVRLVFRRYPMGSTSTAQILTDPADDARVEMPYRSALTGVQPALLLRHLWGPGPRTITVGDRASVTFTPETVEYTGVGGYEPVQADYDEPTLAEYPFFVPENDGRQPALWMALNGAAEGEGWKLSYATEPGTDRAERWDDPDEQVPPFAALTATPPWHW